MSSRPLGIVLIVIYAAINVVLAVATAFLALFGSAFVGAAGNQANEAWLGFLSLLATVLGIVYGAVAYGLWSREPWAPTLTIYVSWASIAVSALFILGNPTSGNVLLNVVGIVIALVIIGYTRKPEIAALYEGRDVTHNPNPET
jgi:hypothetical protein